ncbi:hypothetical protein SCLCIDRAFT_34060 [Scleroderma citrinum Foug A]|uniref:Uncharacterized protein n=1 Tax=Scleroderma citrinum Foug A TaxID=1036808 RepID=A0A0C3D2S6_9AGAM|nr:hypothetical protein SCLCIDRAFT_34060 [Scleroderma citrinum Foug A]
MPTKRETLVVIAVPEGLPLAVTLAPVLTPKRMTKENLLVRVLSLCETMANMALICTDNERKEYSAFHELLQIVPGLEDRLMNSSEEEVIHIADLVQKGVNGAHADDTKGMKSAIIDWITPKGQSLNPHIPRNIKSGRRFYHERTGALLCPAGLDWNHSETRAKLVNGEIQVAGDQWPVFLYADYSYDPEDPWNGLLHSGLLVAAFKHTFTSPSLVDQEPKATRSSNARLHRIRSVMKASIAYIATQVRFSLTSAQVFSQMDLVTDSKCFYNSIDELLNDPEEKDEVNQLLTWWNRYGPISVVTPLTSSTYASLPSLHGQRVDAISKQRTCKDPAEACRKQR